MWAVVCVAGCLSTPDRQTGDGGSSGQCGAASDFTARAFPGDAPVELGIGSVLSTDINNDGQVDLILANSEVASPDDLGVFVLLGPQSDAVALTYHAFVPTNVYPHAVVTKDVLGSDGCLELAVFGANKDSSSGRIEVYKHQGAPTMYGAATTTQDVGFTPRGENQPVMMTFGDFSGRQHGNDIVVSDLNAMRILLTESDFEKSLPRTAPRILGPSATMADWNSVNGIYARSSLVSGTTSDDLVVVENATLTWLRNDGNGDFTVNAPVTAASGEFSTVTATPVDLDGEAPLDLIGGAGANFGAYLMAANGNTVDIKVRAWNGPSNVYNELNEVLVGELGGPGTRQPEVIILEADETTPSPGVGFALLVDGVYIEGTDLQAATPWPFEYAAGFSPTRGLIADFNGDGTNEAWLFDAAGEASCLWRKTGLAELEVCEPQ